LFKIPGWIPAAAWIVKLLFLLVSLQWLAAAVRLVTGMSPAAALVTAKFLKSPMGVHQALHMAKDEMEMVKEDMWSEEIWEAGHPDGTKAVSPLVLYYGKQVSPIIRFSLADN
jgi:hypothetical protein